MLIQMKIQNLFLKCITNSVMSMVLKVVLKSLRTHLKEKYEVYLILIIELMR